MRTARYALVALCALLGACDQEDPTRVDLYFEADAAMRARAHTRRVRVWDAAGELRLDEERTVESGQPAFPFGLRLRPRGSSTPSGFTVEAQLVDDAGTAFAEKRVRGDYVRGESRELRIRFEALCEGVLGCGELTCVAGECVDACVDDLPCPREPRYRALSLQRFATPSAQFVEVAGARLRIPARNTSWLVLVSARLVSEGNWPRGSLARYYLEEEGSSSTPALRGVGSSRDPEDGQGGPWLQFDLLPPSSRPRTIAFELRSQEAGSQASIEDMHVVAFPVPDGSDVHWVDDPAVREVPTRQEQYWYNLPQSLSFVPDAQGTYFVLAQVTAHAGLSSGGDFATRLRVNGDRFWPEPTGADNAPSYFANVSNSWQSFLWARTLDALPPISELTFDVQTSGAPIGANGIGSEVQFVRILALRTDAFPMFAEIVSELAPTTVGDAAPPLAVEGVVPTSGSLQDTVVVQLATLSGAWRPVAFDAADRQVSFTHFEWQPVARFPYGMVSAHATATDIALRTQVDPAPDGSTVEVKERVTFAFGL